jgi:two-component system sensor histidine kinase QseC
MNSLRARLVGLILLAVGVVWLATAFVVWNEAHHELHELLDELPPAVRADLEHQRKEVIGEIAEHLAKPVLIAFPLLALLLTLAVTWALHPLKRLATEVATRDPERLEPLPTEGAPIEVKPLIERLNRLFESIARALDNERRFTADAAHELRTPLAALKAQAQVAQAANDAPARDHALKQIIAGCDRATHLTEQLLLLARLDAPRDRQLQTIALHERVPQLMADLAGTAVGRGSTLEWVEGAQLSIQGDETLLTVLLRNLIDNALRHNPPGTHVVVTVTADKGRPTLTVSDNGPGITGADAMAMTQRFRRGEGSTSEGSGLGLSIVQRIAELHGARFELAKVGAASAGRFRPDGLPAGGTAARLIWPRQ